MKVLFRLGIFLSALWAVGILLLSQFMDKEWAVFFLLFGIIPLLIFWGLTWVFTGMFKHVPTKKIKIIFFVAFLIIFGFIAFSLIVTNIFNKEKAFMNATWSMSPAEVEIANNSTLKADDFSVLITPPISDKSRFELYIQDDLFLFGTKAVVKYNFFDRKLYRYIIVIESISEEKAYKEILGSLIEKYGNGEKTPRTNEDEALSLKWIHGNQDITFSLYKKNNSEYNAIIRIINIPLLKEIQKISSDEKKSYFN